MSRDDGLDCRILALPARLAAGNTPYVRLLHEGLRADGCSVADWRPTRPWQSADILHVHWPEAVFWNRLAMLHRRGAQFAADRLLATVARVRARGGAVVWTIHDLWPHDGVAPALLPTWESFFPALLGQVDAVVSLTRTGLREAQLVYPSLLQRPSLIAPHPHFRDVLPAAPSREAARRALGLPDDAVVMCSVGQVRPYKGILQLIEAFAAARTGAVLIVGGNCQDRALARQLRRAAAAAGGSVRLDLRVLSDEEMIRIYAAADMAVFNFGSILNSGSVLTALSLDRPVIAPTLGSLVEVGEAVGPDWMRLVERVTPEVLRESLAWLQQTRRAPRPPLAAFDPAAIVRQHRTFFRALLAGQAPAAGIPAGQGVPQFAPAGARRLTPPQ